LTDDQTGGGSDGNADAGTILTLDANVSGIDNSLELIEPASGGTDIESVEDFRQRGLLAYQNPPQVGVMLIIKNGRWLFRSYPCMDKTARNGGRKCCYIMCDGNDATNNGFPHRD
jgi:hypothetical protein